MQDTNRPFGYSHRMAIVPRATRDDPNPLPAIDGRAIALDSLAMQQANLARATDALERGKIRRSIECINRVLGGNPTNRTTHSR